MASASRIACGFFACGAAPTPEYTGRFGAENLTFFRALANGAQLGETTDEWNAVATGRRLPSRPSPLSLRSNPSIASVGPESTTCVGWLWLATPTSAP